MLVRTILLAGLLLGVGVVAAVAPTASACAWNRGMTDPIEEASGERVQFHDGGVCWVSVEP